MNFNLFLVYLKLEFVHLASDSSDKDSEKDAEDGDGIASMLGLQSYWDATYTDELQNFREHGHAGEIW